MVNKCYNVANVEVDEASTVDVDDGSFGGRCGALGMYWPKCI